LVDDRGVWIFYSYVFSDKTNAKRVVVTRQIDGKAKHSSLEKEKKVGIVSAYGL
jgi:hypothetical protein